MAQIVFTICEGRMTMATTKTIEKGNESQR